MGRTFVAGRIPQQRLDALGLAISGVCLVHCIALPLAAIVIPAFTLGLDQQSDHTFHWLLLGCAVPISTLALWRGSQRSADRRWLWLGSVGLALMLIGVLHAFGQRSEVPLTSVGVTLLAFAHVKNFGQANHARHAEAE
jgi:hypothetical protein